MMIIKTLKINELKIPKWGVTSILRPEKMLLKLSMIESGWLQPIVVRTADNTIIDGFHRCEIALEDPKFIKKHGVLVPVVYHDVSEIEAMIVHVRLNRSRGSVNSYALSKLVKRIVSSGLYEENDLCDILLMHDDEIDVLMANGLLKKKNWQKYEYSRAWVPIEVANPSQRDTVVVERPPNADR